MTCRCQLHCSRRHFQEIESILKHRLDETCARLAEAAAPVPHDKSRGPRYYQ